MLFASTQSTNDYYPFGSQLPNRGFDPRSYKFGFNGKENDDEVYGDGNFQDYGMRYYDTRVGRFVSVDPITKEYPMLTPYQFASNRTVDGIDRDGLEFSESKDGTIVFSAVLVNSSDKDINLHLMRNNIIKQYGAMFGKGFDINIRVSYTQTEVADGEALMIILNSDNFVETATGVEGGNAKLGGRRIELNAGLIDESGQMWSPGASYKENSAYAEEIGHLGGLLHPFEINKPADFVNGEHVSTIIQGRNIDTEYRNFMNYPQNVIKEYISSKGEVLSTYDWTMMYNSLLKEFSENPSGATSYQKAQIKINFEFGRLNQGSTEE